MNEAEIIGQLPDKDKDRIRSYKEWLDFYQGKQWPGRERWGEKRLTFNYARVFIDKLTSYLMSGINFTVEAVRDTPEALAAAERAEKALARVYETNALEQLDFETETDCAILGDGCYKVVWDPDIKDVLVTAPDIQGIFVWWRGDNLAQVWRVAARYVLSADEVEFLYKVKPANKSSTLVEVWTDTDFELYLDSSLLEKKPNPYGFIPFIVFPNLREPKQFWGTSDLMQIIEPQRELNRAMSQVSHILELSGNPVAVLENVEGSTDIAVRPGAVWNIPEDAKAYLLDLLQGGGLQLHISYIDLLYRALHDISESPRAAFGGMDRNLSGVAMQIELYPLMQKVIRKRIIRSSVYNRRNSMILKLLEKFRGEDFGEYSLRTVWGQVFPEDLVQLVANEQTLVAAGIHSRKRAMDELGVKDPEAEFRHWLEEQRIILSAEKEVNQQNQTQNP
ncbi:MAG: phage portal protein [Dehalococcoidales bacterium]|nr:phage portal protein [Dehalococcoidales bacterium]